jgi:hypothetical protein
VHASQFPAINITNMTAAVVISEVAETMASLQYKVMTFYVAKYL